MANPSSNYFLVSIESNDKTPATAKIMNGSGQCTDTNQRIAPGSIIRAGEHLKGGLYYLHVIQGANRKVVKLIKLN